MPNVNDFKEYKDKVKEGIWDDTVEILKIKNYRHSVFFKDEGDKSDLTYCNFCGSSFIIKSKKTEIVCCTSCGLRFKTK